MSRRARAVAFLAVAVACAAVAASIADGYGASVAGQFGDLQPVVVTGAELRPKQPLGPGDLRGSRCTAFRLASRPLTRSSRRTRRSARLR
jgi:hypothetical protein